MAANNIVKLGGSSGDGYRRFDNERLIANQQQISEIDLTIRDEPSVSFNNGKSSAFLNSGRASDTEIVELTNSNGFEQNENGSDMLFHEAAIYLEEGKNNEKFDSHPQNEEALPAYLMVHNKWYYSLDLLTSIVLLALALGEDPAVSFFRIPVYVHALIEIIALVVIGVELMLKLQWIGWTIIFKHKRTMVKGITLLVMLFEALVVLLRGSSHFRVTRALRPIFLIDSQYMGGVRRFIRQIFQSLPPIIDMLTLIFFYVVLYAIVGFFLFSHINNNFNSVYDSLVSMFVLLTTANFPDVMLPSYAECRWYAIFFISYLCVVLYLLMNFMLAVVYETFTSVDKEKMKKLYLHKRKACELAFELLVSKQPTKKLRFKQFRRLIQYFAPEKSDRDIVIIFKYLNVQEPGHMTKEEFCKIYDAIILKWEPQYANIPWYHAVWMPVQRTCQMSYTIVSTDAFEFFFYGIILLNAFAMVYRAYWFEGNNLDELAKIFCASWDTIFFSTLFTAEVVMKMLGLGAHQYFDSGWNTFDFVSTVTPILGVLILDAWPSCYYVVVFRPLKTFRLFKMKKRYRDIIGTMALLTPLIKSALIVMLVVYYFFAVVGMELFSGYDMRDCCRGTVVEDFYQYTVTNGTSLGYYYLNTFPNIAVSMVTLFELTVGSNWFILMHAYASVVHPITRIYFIMFYIFTMVVLTLVVASILEAFRFRIQYKKQTSKRDEEKMLHEEVDLKWEHIMSWMQDFQLLEKLRPELVVGGTTTFIGRRPRSREVLQSRMFQGEIELWLTEGTKTDP